MKRERLEITFGAKDADLWEYLEQTGLPKASIVKQLMRAGINAQDLPVVKAPVVPIKSVKVESVEEKVEKVQEVEVVEETTSDGTPDKKPGFFGGLATKR